MEWSEKIQALGAQLKNLALACPYCLGHTERCQECGAVWALGEATEHVGLMSEMLATEESNAK